MQNVLIKNCFVIIITLFSKMSVMYNKYIFGRRVFKMAEATKKVNVKDATAKTAATTATAAKATTTKTAAKATTTKAATTKTAAKAAPAKKTTTTKKATTAKKTAAKKTTAKKTTAKKTTAKKSAVESIHIQFDGRSYESTEVIKMCKDAFKANNKRKPIDEINVYVNANERTAYYVVKSGNEEIKSEEIKSNVYLYE